MKAKDRNKLVEIVRGKFAMNQQWAIKAMVRIYDENQTTEEKQSQDTIHDNGIGFSGADSFILSSFSEQVKAGRNMSDKQMAIIFKKMKKYANQVIAFIPEDRQLKLLGQ